MIYPSLSALLTGENRSSPGYLCVISKYLVWRHLQLLSWSIRSPTGGGLLSGRWLAEISFSWILRPPYSLLSLLLEGNRWRV